jgi:rhodanese-related sulfurtransferase
VDPVMDGVWIARMPVAWELGRLPSRRLVDLCAELSVPSGLAAYRGVPSLDLVPLAGETLRDAAAAIEALRRDGPVVVVCALGYGRSAAAVAAWLVATGRVPDVEAAITQLRAIRPRIAVDAPALGRALAPRTIPGAAGAVA